eukprot:s4510_g5.t1
MKNMIDKFVIMFVDNEPARHALTKGFGKDDSINCLLQYSWRQIEELSLRPAWQRVTSSANVSDAVRRGDLRHARAEGGTPLVIRTDSLRSRRRRATIGNVVISKGTIGHPHSCRGLGCKFASKERGCREGADCLRCHLCIWSRASEKAATDQEKAAQLA